MQIFRTFTAFKHTAKENKVQDFHCLLGTCVKLTYLRPTAYSPRLRALSLTRKVPSSLSIKSDSASSLKSKTKIKYIPK